MFCSDRFKAVYIICLYLVLLTSSRGFGFPIKVDVGNGAVKAGYIQMTGVLGSDGFVTVEGVTFTASCYLAGDEKWRSYAGGDIGGDYFDCDNGFGNPEGSIILTISNLGSGSYSFTSYHNNAEPSYRSPLDVSVSGDDVTLSTAAMNVPVTQNTVDDNIGIGTVEFTKSGGSDVVITFMPTSNLRPEGMMCLNGFELDISGARFEFEESSSEGLEAVTDVNVGVVLSEAAAGEVRVNYAVTGGTAVRGEDYLLDDGEIVFEAGQTERGISIIVVDDGEDENDETIELTLSDANGAELGSAVTHTYTILDPRPCVSFAADDSIVGEGEGYTLVEVMLGESIDGSVVVDYNVTGGSATGGNVDYLLNKGTLYFSAFETSKYIAVIVNDDGLTEGPETVEISLSDPNGGKLCEPTVHILTIDDDELGQSFTNTLGMEFELVMGGTFIMGSGDGHRIQDVGELDYDEQPAHYVTISKPFYISKTKVTAGQLAAAGIGADADDISWEDANSFVQWLSGYEGRSYNLPTEAQWEYVFENPGEVNDLGSREWVRDWHVGYGYNSLTDPVGPEAGILKVIRTDGQNRYALPTNATYAPWHLGEAGACSFRIVMEHDAVLEPTISAGAYCNAAVKQNESVAGIGPTPVVPYFTVRFAMPIPPDNIEDGIASLLGCDAATMHHSHSPGFEIMPNGDTLAVYFTAHGSEYAPDVRFVQAKLRYGADQWDMPELFWDMKGMNDESGLLWRDADGTVYFFGGGRINNSANRPFVMAKSVDSGASWELRRPDFPISASSFTAQPVTTAWRSDANNIYMVTDGASSDSMVWHSADNGVTWYDTGGRTRARHSTILPRTDGSWLSLSGKNYYVGDHYMPQDISTNDGASWTGPTATVFSHLGSNQRPSLTRLANGKLAFCSDAQHRDGTRPSGMSYGRGAIIALSDDEGLSWHIKNLPVTLPHESDRDDGTIGYSTIRQAPNGTFHILSTMTHPCLHYEFNEEWVYSGLGDIAPETSGGTVNQYYDYYPGGALKAAWSARTCTNGRYLLEGSEISYYADGGIEHEASYNNGTKTGMEYYFDQGGRIVWTWDHDDVNNVSTWTHYRHNGIKRIESRWDSYPVARDLSRNFSGFVADGNSYHWSKCGMPEKTYVFSNGIYQGESDDLPEALGYITADITGDCRVDEDDLGILAADWLKTGEEISVSPPDANKLILYYEFEETSGSYLSDLSGHGYNGLFFTDVNQTPGEISARMEEGIYGQSIHMSPRLYDAGISIPAELYTENNITEEISLCVWLKNAHPDESPDSGTYMWEFREWDGVSTTGGDRVLAVESTSTNSYFTFHDDSGSTQYSLDWSGHTDWHHYAFARDGANLTIYVDGEEVSQGLSSPGAMASPGLLYFGISADRAPFNTVGLHDAFTGNFDELKIYSYALGELEAMSLAGGGGSIIILPLESAANLYEDGIIDFRDFAQIVREWLDSIE